MLFFKRKPNIPTTLVMVNAAVAIISTLITTILTIIVLLNNLKR